VGPRHNKSQKIRVPSSKAGSTVRLLDEVDRSKAKGILAYTSDARQHALKPMAPTPVGAHESGPSSGGADPIHEPREARSRWGRAAPPATDASERPPAGAALDTVKVHLPSSDAGSGLDQDQEWCEIELDGKRQRIRLHDYAAIFSVPGLYEQLYSEILAVSPEIVCQLLAAELIHVGVDPATLKALDFGAGNGMAGEQLAAVGIGSIVGIDLLPEARDAALRDRPGIYEDYYAVDMIDLDPADRRELLAHSFNAMVCVAALGFGDIPPAAFAEAFNLVGSTGWIAFNLRDRFIDEDDPAGFGALIAKMFDQGLLEEQARVNYTHRLSVAGEALEYSAIVARKRADVPSAWTRQDTSKPPQT
jgi:hypothetical protein